VFTLLEYKKNSEWYFTGVSLIQKNEELFNYHLFYTKKIKYSISFCSKGSRVFLSYHKTIASSRQIQLHRFKLWDSGEVVTPFMQVNN